MLSKLGDFSKIPFVLFSWLLQNEVHHLKANVHEIGSMHMHQLQGKNVNNYLSTCQVRGGGT